MPPIVPKTLKEYNDILDFIYKMYPIALAIFLVFDILTFQQFGFKTGFLIQIAQDINISSFSMIFLFLMIPFITVLLLVLSFYIVKKFSIYIFSCIKKQINLIYTSLIIILYILCLCCLFSFQKSAILIYIFFLIAQVIYNVFFLSIYYSEFYNKLSDTLKNKFLNKREIYILIFFSLTIMLLFFAIKFTFVELSTTSLILLLNFITALLMHNITKELETNLSESSENKDITNTEPEKNSDELNQIINLFTTLCILSILYTFYDLNQQIWSKPIENGKLQGGEEQKTMNLIFNRGFLLDLNEDINLSIPTRLQDDKKLYERLKYNQNIKVLPIGNVYKMYFLKKDDNTTKIYLVEEIKLKDNSESKLNLIAESSLSTNN